MTSPLMALQTALQIFGKSKMADNSRWRRIVRSYNRGFLKAAAEHDFHCLGCLCEELAQRIGKFTWQEKFVGELSVDFNANQYLPSDVGEDANTTNVDFIHFTLSNARLFYSVNARRFHSSSGELQQLRSQRVN